MTKGERTITQLEWFSITYRTVILYGGTIVLAAAGGLGYWFWTQRIAPRQAAASSIQQAENNYKDATPYADALLVRQTLERASLSLGEARDAFNSSNYDDARFAALHSSDLSLQALEAARGNETSTKMVRFYRLEGDVRVKHSGEFSWTAATPKSVLNIGDQVKTSSSGSAQLIYFDGTVTTILPASLLEIRDLYEDPVTRVRRVKEKLNFGEVNASTPDRNVRGSYHEVSTDKLTARSEQAGEFRVAFDQKLKTTVVDTFKGQIEVSSAGRRESLLAGERIRARADGGLVDKQALPMAPRLLAPADQRVFIFDEPQGKVSLTWEPVPGAGKYRLLISDKALFTEPLYDAEREGDTAVLEVGQGTYHWKAAAINASGVRGPFSQPQGFRVSNQRIKDRGDTVPPALTVTDFVTIGMMVIVNGQSEPGATLWIDNEKIDVYDDGRFYAVVRLRKEGLNEVQLRAQDTAGNETRVSRQAHVETF